ncbi:MAG: 4-demethylwyosine synthase TYW1, partial [Thaumarchaeota archaeon]|nr:4-demethylwyosine synthase TYW1 [Nitrososphaerota archaeon]
MSEDSEYQFIKFNDERQKKYKRAGYRLVGEFKHTGVEVCRWTKTRIRGERNCYKAVYGIKSHRCVQMTPTLDFCSFSCQFCWRDFGPDRFRSEGKWDTPKTIVDGIINAQRLLLSGFGGHEKTSKQTFAEAMDPEHVAISLDGEPTLYPHLPELIREIKARGMTAFLVTNGTMPNRLKELLEKDAEPTNLYISVYATNPEDYKTVTRSFIPDAWEKVLESLKLMKEFKNSRTIFRMTL